MCTRHLTLSYYNNIIKSHERQINKAFMWNTSLKSSSIRGKRAYHLDPGMTAKRACKGPIQVHVYVRTCRFKSCFPHQAKVPVKSGAFVIFGPQKTAFEYNFEYNWSSLTHFGAVIVPDWSEFILYFQNSIKVAVITRKTKKLGPKTRALSTVCNPPPNIGRKSIFHVDGGP